MIEYRDDNFREDEDEQEEDDDGVIHAESATGLELRERVRLNLLQKWFKSN